MENGWIKVHRKMTEWEWYQDPNTCRLFLHLLLTVNHKPMKWRGIEVPIGSKITSREKLSQETGLSQRQVRTALSHLESTNEVTKSTTSTHTLITVVNFEKYQVTDQVTDQRPTNERPSTDQRPTTNKNDKNDKNEKKRRSIYSAEGAVDASFQTLEAREAMKAYLQMRESMKKPVKTERAYKLLIDKLHKLAKTETEMVPIIDQSIERNWMSFFELKEDRQKVQPNKLPDHPFFREI